MSDLLSAISVLLVFLTLLLSGMQSESDDILATMPPPAAQTANYAAFRKRVTRQIFKTFAITLIFLVICWILLPRTCGILRTSRFSPWHFDELPTIFVCIETGVLGMSVFGSIYIVRLSRHLRISHL